MRSPGRRRRLRHAEELSLVADAGHRQVAPGDRQRGDSVNWLRPRPGCRIPQRYALSQSSTVMLLLRRRRQSAHAIDPIAFQRAAAPTACGVRRELFSVAVVDRMARAGLSST
jgi:hypothetical protein